MSRMDAVSAVGDAEAITAFQIATRLLKAAGMSWGDLARARFSEPAISAGPCRAERPQPARAARPQPASRNFYDALSNPTIVGTLRVNEIRGLKNGGWMVFVVIKTKEFDAINAVAFGDLLRRIENLDPDVELFITLAPPPREALSPRIVRIEEAPQPASAET